MLDICMDIEYNFTCVVSDARKMREWLSGIASPCQGEGRGFDPRLALFFYIQKGSFSGTFFEYKDR